MVRAAAAAMVALVLAGCGMTLRAPVLKSGAADAYFSTRMCVFNFDGKAREVRLRIQLNVIRPLPRNGLLVVQFENPIAPGTPLVTTRKLTGEEKTLDLVSPPLFEISPRSYEIVALVYATEQKQAVLGTHSQVCESPFDQRDVGAPFR